MKPIILNIDEMSESVEVYEAKPKKAIIYTIYTIFILMVVAILWAYFFKIEISVNSEGIIKNDAEEVSVSAPVTGKISKCNVKDGQLVQKGDTLFVIDIENLDQVQMKKSNLTDKNYTVQADSTGYISLSQNLIKGDYIQEGSSIGQIIPQNDEKFIAEIYIDNKDIADIKEGQKVKFEMTSFPSRDYGEFSGTIKEISKNMKMDDKTGKAYYLVRASFDKDKISNQDGKNINLMNEMLCQAKVITKEESILDYLLKELSLKE